MKKLLLLAAAVAMTSTLSGCYASFAYSGRGVTNGLLYAETKAGEHIDGNTIGSKTGEACSESYLGFVTTGDTSYITAARNGGIKKISTIDNRYKNILGFYATYCTVVTGE
jgi:TRL-like protein family